MIEDFITLIKIPSFVNIYSQTKKFINDGILNDGDVNPFIYKKLFIYQIVCQRHAKVF